MKSVDDKITHDYIMENSRLSFDTVYGIIHDDVFPLLGIEAPPKYSYNEYNPDYIQFSQKI